MRKNSFSRTYGSRRPRLPSGHLENLQLTDILRSGAPLSHRSVIITSYALSGFANIAGILTP